MYLPNYKIRSNISLLIFLKFLTESSEQLIHDYDNLYITGIIDTYEGGLEFLKHYDDKKNLITFLGSSFGNFSPSDGYTFLHKIHSNNEIR